MNEEVQEQVVASKVNYEEPYVFMVDEDFPVLDREEVQVEAIMPIPSAVPEKIAEVPEIYFGPEEPESVEPPRALAQYEQAKPVHPNQSGYNRRRTAYRKRRAEQSISRWLDEPEVQLPTNLVNQPVE